MDESTLAEVEALCQQLYGPSGNSSEAFHRLRCFRTAEYFPKLMYLLNNSQSPEAMLMGGNALGEMLLEHWNAISADDSISARDNLFSLLWDKGAMLPEVVAGSIIKGLAVLIKKGWIDDERHQQAPVSIRRFLDEHRVIGMRILIAIIEEMNKRYTADTIARHRKAAISFRDTVLEDIFSTALNGMHQMRGCVPSNPLENAVKEVTLLLVQACLEFDFIGTSPDQTGLDMGTVQIPNSWRPMFEDSSRPLIPMFFEMYAESHADHAKTVMECLVSLASVRKSLFSDEKVKLQYLSHLIEGITNVLRHETNLQHSGCHHECCRVLARMRANFHLSMLVQAENYEQWVHLVCEFTVRTFHAWQWAPNSLYYLLSVWASLVRGIKVLTSDTQHQVREFTPRVVHAYVTSRMGSVRAAMGMLDGCDPLDDDPLGNEPQIKIELESLKSVARCAYEESGRGLISVLDPLAVELKERLGAQNFDNVPLIDGQLAWLVYILGSVTGDRSPPVSAEHDVMDGELVVRVFQLMQIHHQRLERYPQQEKTFQLESFELSLLHFMECFRRTYIGDKAVGKSLVFKRLNDAVGLPTQMDVLDVLVQKLITNLNWWRDENDVISGSLVLFYDVAAGFNSGKLLVKIPRVGEILRHHTVEHFAFLGYPANLSCRTRFYTTLGRILLTNEHIEKFDEFMRPFDHAFGMVSQLNSVEEMRNEECRDCLIGLLRDLRGLVFACSQRNTYLLFFEWIFPQYTQILHRIVEAFHDCPEVTSVFLSFLLELVTNSNNRLNFDCSSANGILLFRETSSLLCSLGERLYNVDIGNKDPYKVKFKGIKQCLVVVTKCLGGNYINFGVFELYNDPALRECLGTCLKLALDIPPDELMGYPKLVKAFYGLVQALCQFHIKQLVELDPRSFQHILRALLEGLTSITLNVFHECCSSIDHLATYIFKYRRKDSETSHKLKQHLSQGGNFFGSALELLFQVLLFVDSANHWTIARPMLSLILIDPDQFRALSESIVRSQPNDRQDRLMERFVKLMEGVHNNLLSANREKFTHNLTAFRYDVKTFIVVVT